LSIRATNSKTNQFMRKIYQNLLPNTKLKAWILKKNYVYNLSLSSYTRIQCFRFLKFHPNLSRRF
jgi:hypothetical protein